MKRAAAGAARRSLDKVRAGLMQYESKEDAEVVSRFFKCGKGEYGEGDQFIGARNPEVRQVHKEHRGVLSAAEISQMMDSKYNEERFLALLFLIDYFHGKGVDAPKDKTVARETAYALYLQFAEQGKINNWNLVDLSAPDIVGEYLLSEGNNSEKKRQTALDALVNRRESLWLRRIAVVSTLALIRAGHLTDPLRLTEILMQNKEQHDLMHKACGWMLREVGKRDEDVLVTFLNKNVSQMPRTMLRNAIERLSPKQRERYMNAPSEVLRKRPRGTE